MVQYQSDGACDVTLKICDMLGKEITLLVNERQSAGVHRIEWDGTNFHGKDMASGLYVYRVFIGHRVFTGKMVLLR